MSSGATSSTLAIDRVNAPVTPEYPLTQSG